MYIPVARGEAEDRRICADPKPRSRPLPDSHSLRSTSIWGIYLLDYNIAILHRIRDQNCTARLGLFSLTLRMVIQNP